MRRILVLRPEPGASETVSSARERGLDAVSVPLFEIEPVKWEVPAASSFDGLLLTSANAVRAAGDGLHQLRGLPVHAVGEATARAAREAGCDIATTGDAGVERLLASIDPALKLLHLCGVDRKVADDSRQQITSVPVYRAREIADPDIHDVSGALALIHSPRAGRRFAELVEERGGTIIAAISEAATEAAGSGWQKVETADRPSDEALLALAERLCNNPRGE
jgi:uroporphyrinogen-III synthase